LTRGNSITPVREGVFASHGVVYKEIKIPIAKDGHKSLEKVKTKLNS